MTEKNKKKRDWKQTFYFTLLLIGLGFSGFVGLELFYAILNVSVWDILFAIVILIVSFPLHIILHELGHLIAGLLSGYTFIMFRLFSWVWIKTEEGISRRKQRVSGLLGQALMLPPESVENPPMLFYHLGGLLTNLLTALFMLGIGWWSAHPRVTFFLFLSASIALLLFLMNSAWQKGTDGYNILQLYKRPEALNEMTAMLRLYGGMVQGVSFTNLQRYIPADLGTTFENPNTITFYTAQAAVYFERGEFVRARKIYERLWSNRKQLLALHLSEVYFNYLFTLLITEPEHPDIEKIKATPIFKQSIDVEAADVYKVRAAEAIYLNKEYEKAKQLLSTGEQLIATAPTVTEEKLEAQFYAYLKDEIRRLEKEGSS